jgi:succinate dehydrogenase / fumarate reductase cytochrome b subunit
MAWMTRFFGSNIGLKILMGLTGVALVGFVIAHMLGNLQVFMGPKWFNHYSEFLQGNKEIIYPLRVVMLFSVVAHIASAAILVRRGRSARPIDYRERPWLGQGYAVRTMRWGGVLLLLFIVYHLLHMTVGVEAVGAAGEAAFRHCEWQGDDFRCDAYANLVEGFRVWYVAAFYVVAQLALAMHLTHGVWSLLRTLGLGNPRWDAPARGLSVAIGVGVGVGNILIPVAVLTNLVTIHGTVFTGAM